jgi:ubiquinone/menaquinone biosynthesis C-methylase UbiE
MPESDEGIVLEHYRQEALRQDLEPSSTMRDLTIRELEVEAILSCVTHALASTAPPSRLLDVGCGNGHLLEVLRERFPSVELWGADYSRDMVELASRRHVENCQVRREDVRDLSFQPSTFDVVASERCLINLLDEGQQETGLRELHRVLRPGGHLVLIEAFTDGLENLNRAREELGLPPNPVPHHNLWFDKDRFLSSIGGRFEPVSPDDPNLPPRNFLSSHYFISRVLYPAITRREVLYNTEFVKFFRFLPPQGEYSPIQLFLLRKLP